MVIARHRKIMLLLLMTLLGMTGQFVVFVYLSPLLRSLADAGATTVGLFFAIYGVTGFLGNVIASGIVGVLGARLTSLIAFALVAAGMLLWALAGGLLPVLAAGMALWGLGFAASNSMQQARLVAAAPTLSSATVALNTSVLYVGQAAGSALGTLLFAMGYLHAMGFVGAGFVAAAIVVWAMIREDGARPSKRALAPRLHARDQHFELRQHAFNDDGVTLRIVMGVVAGAVFSRRQLPLRVRDVLRLGDVGEIETAEADQQYFNAALA